MRNLKRTDPKDVSVGNQMPGSGATGTYHSWLTASVPYNATSTAAAATNWVNPETGTVLAKAMLYFVTAGTGTFDLGRGTNGTSVDDVLIDGGTLTVGVHSQGTVLGTVAASATLGELNGKLWLLGPGTVTGANSFTVTHSDTPTSTAVGRLLVEYSPVGT